MKLLIDEILDPNSDVARHALVTIAGLEKGVGPGGVFAAINLTNLSFNIGNEWNTIKGLSGGASDALTGGAQLLQGDIKKLLDKITGGNSANSGTIVPIFAEQYRALWMGPKVPDFAIEVVIINYKNNDVRQEVLSLYSSVLPGGKKIGFGSILKIPLNYNPRSNGKGTVTVQIGKWFRAPQLIVESVSSSFSKEVVATVDSNGKPDGGSVPLYAKATINFQPMQAITYEQFRGYFLNNSDKLINNRL